MLSDIMLLLMVVSVPSASASTYLQKDVLMKDLLGNYNTDIRPLQDQLGAVNVFMRINVYTITDIDPIQGIVALTMGFSCSWTDELIAWNATEYSGIQSVLLQQKYVWTPSVVIVSSLDQTNLGEDSKDRVKYYSNGMAVWQPTHMIKLVCSFYMKFWPFDKQMCDIIIIVKDDIVNEVKLTSENTEIDASGVAMSEWILEDAEVKARDPSYVSIVSFRLKFKRQPSFYVLTLILPVALIGILIPFVFLLPSDSGERIGFAITIMLSLIVFLTVISDEIPRTTNPVALICGYVMMLILSSVIVTIMTIINLRLHHRSDKRTIGKFWQIIFGRHKDSLTSNKVHNVEMMLNRNDNSTVGNSRIHEMKVMEIVAIDDEFNGVNTELTSAQAKDVIADDECSWQDVSKVIDKYLFIITSVIVTCPSVIFLCYLPMASDYYEF